MNCFIFNLRWGHITDLNLLSNAFSYVSEELASLGWLNDSDTVKEILLCLMNYFVGGWSLEWCLFQAYMYYSVDYIKEKHSRDKKSSLLCIQKDY